MKVSTRFSCSGRIVATCVSLVMCVGCGGGSTATFSVSRETLPNGATLVRYSSLPESAGPPIAPDLRLGDSEEDLDAVFGDVRGIEVDDSGAIYILDHQASEIRAFDAQGQFLRTVVPKGQGPGEIAAANGMVLVEDTALWIKDHSKWQMIKVNTSGHELDAFPIDEFRYAYIWAGTVDKQGRFWKRWSEVSREEPPPSENGARSGSDDIYIVGHDRLTGWRDTVFIGTAKSRVFRAPYRDGNMYMRIPFDPDLVHVVDPDGGVWKVETGEYRIVRMDLSGDTTLVIEAAVDRLPVTATDRRTYVERWEATRPEMLSSAESIAALMPETKPVVAGLVVDNSGRLWVHRTTEADADARYDIFDREGEYLGSLSLAFEPSDVHPIRIRNDRMYALDIDSLDVPVVVRTPPLGLGASRR